MKTVEHGQIFLLACRQLQKNGRHNFIGQFLNLLNLLVRPSLVTTRLRHNVIIKNHVRLATRPLP